MSWLVDVLIDPWTWGEFMWRGTLAAALASTTLAVLGVFLYLRRLSLIADALAHVALPGIVVAFLLSGSLSPWVMILGAAATGLLATFGIESLSARPNIRPDAAIGIVFTALFAAGVILLSTSVQDAHIDTQCTLFGDVLGISDRSLWLLGITAPVVLGLVAVFYRWLAVASFDAGLAASIGVPVAALHYGLMTAISVTAVASFEAIGAILAIAFIIVPAATAHLLADRLPAMIGLAVVHGLVSTVLGMYGSVWLNASSAGMIVVAGGLLYALAFLFAPRHGLVTRWWQRRTRTVRTAEAT